MSILYNMLLELILFSTLGAVNMYTIYVNKKLDVQLKAQREQIVSYIKDNNESLDNQYDIILKHKKQTSEMIYKMKADIYKKIVNDTLSTES